MISEKFFAPKRLLLFISFLVFSHVNSNAQDGKAVFISKCASCHVMGRDLTGPNLDGVETRWENTDQIKVWIKNYNTAIKAGYKRAAEVVNLFQSSMTVFEGSITEPELDAVVKYITEWEPPVAAPTTPDGGSSESSGNSAIIFGIISLIMAIIALILLQVNSNLKKLSDDKEGVHRPEPVAFYKNKAYIALVAIVFFLVGGFYVTRGAIDFGRQKNYQPTQPIFYSHKVHAGINQINCLYCHGAAMDSKHAAIPSTNVCMNCHKTISTYEKGPKLMDDAGNEINGTAQIQKLYEYAGFDPKNANAWDPGKAKAIPWTKIHNLPDHVYFNHSQHIKVGNVQCQTCHGEITNMDVVSQFSELSMSWCVNCHRNTKVDFNKTDSLGRKSGNQFYSIYEKFHNDIKSGKMDSVTVKDIGGLECQKCHY